MTDVDLLITALGMKAAQLKRLILTGVNVGPSSKQSLLSRITEIAPQAGLTHIIDSAEGKAPQIEKRNIQSSEELTKTDDGVQYSIFEAQ